MGVLISHSADRLASDAGNSGSETGAWIAILSSPWALALGKEAEDGLKGSVETDRRGRSNIETPRWPWTSSSVWVYRILDRPFS